MLYTSTPLSHTKKVATPDGLLRALNVAAQRIYAKKCFLFKKKK